MTSSDFLLLTTDRHELFSYDNLLQLFDDTLHKNDLPQDDDSVLTTGQVKELFKPIATGSQDSSSMAGTSYKTADLDRLFQNIIPEHESIKEDEFVMLIQKVL